jgi:hypothetical protein
MDKTEPFYGNNGPLMGYHVNLKITPVLPTSDSDIDKAIRLALQTEKEFNANKFVQEIIW